MVGSIKWNWDYRRVGQGIPTPVLFLLCLLTLFQLVLPDPSARREKKKNNPLSPHWIFMLLWQLSLCQCCPGSKAAEEGFPRKNNAGGAEEADVHYLYWQKVKNNPTPSPQKSTLIIKTQQIYCLDSFWNLSKYRCVAQKCMAWFTVERHSSDSFQENRGSFVAAVIGPDVVGEPGEASALSKPTSCLLRVCLRKSSHSNHIRCSNRSDIMYGEAGVHRAQATFFIITV